MVDDYAAFSIDTINKTPTSVAGLFDSTTTGLTIGVDSDVTDKTLPSLRYDNLAAGGMLDQRKSVTVVGVQANLRDGRGRRIAATDLINRASYKNGASPRDIDRTLITGLDGTPIPSYAGQFVGKEEQLWHVVNDILSLSLEVRP